MSALVLVVDDTPTNLMLLGTQLDAEYFSVITADSGVWGIDLAMESLPDIILLDVMMPDMDGFEVCGRLRGQEETRHIPIIMITAHDYEGQRVRGLECGADDFLVRPVSEQVLFSRIENLVRLKRELDELRVRERMGRQIGLLHGLETFEQMLIREKGRVLILEDQGFFLESMIEALEANFVVDAVSGAAEFFVAVGQRIYDFFIISLSLKEVDGLRICSQLRQEEEMRHVPILAVLGSMSTRNLARAFKIGVNDCIIRPIDRWELVLRCRTQLRRGRYQHYLKNSLVYGIESSAMDIVTCLYNRRYMHSRIEAICRSEHEERKVGVMLFDLDNFKGINDSWGHETGDEVLQQFCVLLRGKIPTNGILGRWGGDEFLLVIEDMAEEEVMKCAQALCRTVAEFTFKVRHETRVCKMTISVGLTFLNPCADSPDALIERVDKALYRAKNAGKNQVCFL